MKDEFMGHKHVKRYDLDKILTKQQYEAYNIKKTYLDKLLRTNPELHRVYKELRIEARRIIGLANRRDYKILNKDKNATIIREYHFKKKYGITLEDYNRMFVEQGGVCAICNSPETALGSGGNISMLSVDHCHKTGRVRALLCKNCNTMLGHAKDSVNTLQKAMKYLVEHSDDNV